MREWISGRNPVYEVLRANRRQPFRLLVAQGVQVKGRLAEILQLCQAGRVPVEWAPRARLDTLAVGHQGLVLETSAYPYAALFDILAAAAQRNEPPFLLILDTLQDPQNLGALLRTAEGVGVHGVLLPLRQTVTVSPAVVHASSGACEHLLIAQVNLAQAIQALKEANIWVVGLENDPQAALPDQVGLEGPLALVVGGEGQGMRPLVRKSCDWLMRLPTRGQLDSLNAAVAGSIALYLAWQRRSL